MINEDISINFNYLIPTKLFQIVKKYLQGKLKTIQPSPAYKPEMMNFSCISLNFLACISLISKQSQKSRIFRYHPQPSG